MLATRELEMNMGSVKRITLIFCFKINRTIYPDLIRLSHLYFLSLFLRERADQQKVKISLQDEHLTIHIRIYTLAHSSPMIFEQ